MYDFTENKASKSSLTKRALVNGIGINDADYTVHPTVDGKRLSCPYYMKWNSMLRRCYSDNHKKKFPTYIGCSVTEEWMRFSNFREWMSKQDWEGMELDKDIKVKDNKIYSPETCLFITKSLNSLLSNSEATRGNYPIGVSYSKSGRKFQAQLSYNGKNAGLGQYETSEEASEVYQEARKEKILELIRDDIYPIATEYLEQHI